MTLHNHKHAAWFQRSMSLTCHLHPQLDSALHILSECQHTQIRNMITKEHNLASSIVFKAINKTGSLGSCFVCMDIGSSERLAMQNPQTPNAAETRFVPKWIFPPRFSDKNRFISSRPDAVLVAPISAKTKKQQASNERGWVLRSSRGQLRETRSTSAAPPAISRSTFPRQHQPKGLIL